MNSIVIAFPKKEAALHIKKILTQSGYDIQAVCVNGAQVLTAVGELDAGIVICGARFVDMVYTELYGYLPEGIRMLLIASGGELREREVENLVCLSLPLKVHELLQTVKLMQESSNHGRRRRQPYAKRSEEERAVVEQAKGVLMERNGFSEEEAHRYIQKLCMDSGTDLVEEAQMILSLMNC